MSIGKFNKTSSATITKQLSSEKTILVVNDIIAKELDVDNYINLFPTLNKSVPWSIDLDEYFIINTYITKFSNEMTDYLIDLNLLKINDSHKAMIKLIRPNVAHICYIIFYRLIRIYRLLNFYKPSQLSLISTHLFSPPSSIKNLYNLTRDSWEFNQFIINQILFDIDKVTLGNKNKLYPKNYWDFSRWSNYEGFNKKVEKEFKKNKLKTFLKNPSNAFQSKIDEIRLKMSSYGNKIPILAMNYNELFFLRNGFFWPKGKFCKLPQSLPNNDTLYNPSLIDRNNFAEKTQEYFIRGCIKLFNKIKLIEYDKKYLTNISKLFFDLYPISMFEQSIQYSDWSINQLKKYKLKHYFTGDTGSSDLGIYYNYAATKLGSKIWSQQHSAWGGYIANVPNIAEVSITGSDYYITSGWKHREPHLPVWNIKSIKMPSPHYSEVGKKKIHVNKNNPVLLLTGQVYNFPILPAGSHEVDTLSFWAKRIEEIIYCLAEKDIQIILKNYAPRVEALLIKYGILEKWMKAGGDNIKLLKITKKGSAQLFFKESSVVIWDMPSGGFAESIMMGIPTFSFWNNKFIRYQPEAKKELEKLLEVGIINDNAEQMAENIENCIMDDNWWNESVRIETLKKFMSKYVKTNKDWRSEWESLISNLDNKEYN